MTLKFFWFSHIGIAKKMWNGELFMIIKIKRRDENKLVNKLLNF